MEGIKEIFGIGASSGGASTTPVTPVTTQPEPSPEPSPEL